MPWISLPKELALPYLLDFRGIAAPLRERFEGLLAQFDQDDPEGALASVDICYGSAKRGFDRYGQALALVLEAEAHRRLACWEESLDAIRHALRWLELQVTPWSRYNEALTVYLEGVIHITLQSWGRAEQTFAYAQHLLAESERSWSVEGHAGRAADCRNLVRWMTQLLDLRATSRPHPTTAILPVYEFVDRVLIRTDVLAVTARSLAIPAEALAPYLPSSSASRPRADASAEEGRLVLPLHSAMLPFPYLDPSGAYVAVRAPVDGSLWDQDRKGDVLIIEVTGAVDASQRTLEDAALTADVPFERRSDGKIVVGVGLQDARRSLWPVGCAFVGIPRVLIREGEQR